MNKDGRNYWLSAITNLSFPRKPFFFYLKRKVYDIIKLIIEEGEDEHKRGF
jgi:hypothetical protein